MANSDPVCGDTPTVIITKEKLGFGLCHSPCIYLWLRDMVFSPLGFRKERSLLALSWLSLCCCERKRGNFTPSPAPLSGQAGQVQADGQRAVQDPADSKPQCFQRKEWSRHIYASCAVETGFSGTRESLLEHLLQNRKPPRDPQMKPRLGKGSSLQGLTGLEGYFCSNPFIFIPN